MKMSKRILAIVLSLVMMISLIPMSFAKDRTTSTVEDYIAPANLGIVAETLLKDLGTRAQKFAPAALALVFKLVGPMKDAAAAAGIADAYTASTEELCKALISFADEKLAELDLNSKIGSYSNIIRILGVDLKDLNSVNGLFTALYTALNKTIKDKRTWGDLASLKENALARGTGNKAAVMQTTDKVQTPNYDMLNGLLEFMSDNAAVIGKIVSEGLNFGSMNGLVKAAGIDVEATVNDIVKDIPGLIKGLAYDYLLAAKDENGDSAPAYEDSEYKSYTIDELLASALINLVEGAPKGTVVAQADAKEAAGKTLYQLIGTYADKAIARYALEPLNTSLKDVIKNAISGDAELKSTVEKILNMNYNFTASTLNFASYAQTGLFENLNNIIVTILNTMLTDDAKKAIALETGDNTKLTPNLTKVCKFALTTLATYNGGDIGGFDFSKYTAEAVEKLSLEDMAVSVLGLFMSGWFGKDLPANATELEQIAAWAEYNAIEKWYVEKYPEFKPALEAKKGLVFAADGTNLLTGKTQAYWYNAMAEIGMELAEFALDYVSKEGYVKAYTKAADGADWVKKADTVVDWALAYVDGFPAITDELKTGDEVAYPAADTYVEYGPFYKVNVILNDLFPLSFINGASDGYFPVDVEKLFMDNLLPSITDFTLDKFATAFAQNTNEDNPFNKPLLEGLVSFIDNFLFSLFEYDQPDDGVAVDKAATYWSQGFKGTANAADKYYHKVTASARLELPADAAEPTPDYMEGDVNGDGKVLADDARLALRASASLEKLEGTALLAADVDGNGQIFANDARQILRFSAQLQNVFEKA